MSLTEARTSYKPFFYPWAYEFWTTQQNLHWLAREVPMDNDIRDFNSFSPAMRSVVTTIFRNFVQADIDVQNCYFSIYQKLFKPVEVQMMLAAFSNAETIHIDAYSHLIDSLGLPETEYGAFLTINEMKDKHDFMRGFNPQDPQSVAETLAAVSAFGEGLSLFASFAILLNFPRQNLLKGMGQIVSWSVRDESLHCEGVLRLYHTWLNEHPDIDRTALAKRIVEICQQVIMQEDAFCDLVFQAGDIPGLSAQEVKKYIRYIANIRLRQLGQPDLYDVVKNPLPWIDTMQTAPEHANFFEAQATEYSKAATKGTWGDAFN